MIWCCYVGVWLVVLFCFLGCFLCLLCGVVIWLLLACVSLDVLGLVWLGLLLGCFDGKFGLGCLGV